MYFFHGNSCILSKFYIKPQLVGQRTVGIRSCILSKFYIKPQHAVAIFSCQLCCILSKFYIKPQLASVLLVRFIVVSYRNSTSNHNFAPGTDDLMLLYLIEILHQTTTIRIKRFFEISCILSKFYIKPQLRIYYE